jgi:acyl carrier protein
MENRIKNVLADVLMIDVVLITDDVSPETIEEWDSLKQMNIVIALEEEFDIVLNDDEVIEMLNFKLICNIIKEKLNKYYQREA